jgi:hypothetical protein
VGRRVSDRQQVTNNAKFFCSSPFYSFTTKTFRDSAGKGEADLITSGRMTFRLGERRTEGMQACAIFNCRPL